MRCTTICRTFVFTLCLAVTARAADAPTVLDVWPDKAPGEMSWRDYLVLLLHIAAEIEKWAKVIELKAVDAQDRLYQRIAAEHLHQKAPTESARS